MSWQCTPAAQTSKSVSWAALVRALPAGRGRWSFPPAWHWKGHAWSAMSSSGVPRTRNKENMDLMEQFQQGEIKMIKGLEHPFYEERLQEPGLFSLQKKRVGWIISICVNTWSKGAGKREPKVYLCSPVAAQEVMSTNWKVKLHLNTWKGLSRVKKVKQRLPREVTECRSL